MTSCSRTRTPTRATCRFVKFRRSADRRNRPTLRSRDARSGAVQAPVDGPKSNRRGLSRLWSAPRRRSLTFHLSVAPVLRRTPYASLQGFFMFGSTDARFVLAIPTISGTRALLADGNEKKGQSLFLIWSAPRRRSLTFDRSAVDPRFQSPFKGLFSCPRLPIYRCFKNRI